MPKIIIYVSHEEYKVLKDKALKMHYPLSTVLRMAITGLIDWDFRTIQKSAPAPVEKSKPLPKRGSPIKPSTFDPAASDAAVDAYINSPESKAEAARWNSIPPVPRPAPPVPKEKTANELEAERLYEGSPEQLDEKAFNKYCDNGGLRYRSRVEDWIAAGRPVED